MEFHMSAKILVVEDDFYFSELIESAMEKQGLTYDLFVRASNTSTGVSFMRPDGTTEVIDLSNYWLTLCDSRLKGSAMQGTDLAASLSAKGMTVIAISGMDSLNNSMVEAGALLGIRKDTLWIDLFKGRINLAELVKTAKSKRSS
jgi:DNA-binding NtrC family response regulator